MTVIRLIARPPKRWLSVESDPAAETQVPGEQRRRARRIAAHDREIGILGLSCLPIGGEQEPAVERVFDAFAP